MSGLKKLSLGALLVGAGYLCGMAQMFVNPAGAQPAQEISQGASDDVRDANAALRKATQTLESEQLYRGITLSPTAFLVLAGGGDAQADLESGNGVDPETFAALYAAMSIPGEDGLIDPLIREALSVNADGQVEYNGEVVKLYSRQRLEQYFAARTLFSETQL